MAGFGIIRRYEENGFKARMNLNSKYFDMIRMSRRREPIAEANRRVCDWPDCDQTAAYPAPAGPRQSQQRHFCFEHVRQYNQSYDFFEGLSDEDIEAYRRGATTGHRPTWSMGARRAIPDAGGWRISDPLEIMGHAGPVAGELRRRADGTHVTSGQRRALQVLDLEDTASAKDVKQRFKQLVKKYHPDTNGGDRRHEARLQKVIKAHDFLKASGFC
jgi:DnaJ-domain-containing protein 1